ncbi:MAG: molybdopterin-dependent oxidoreductase [Deltaproteobacteria bacterium]|nr:molybdopterin-dependent oxidoreductase [Deltaproteobacteria bacterium]
MKEKVRLTIDGQQVEVEKGTTILEAAKQLHINIPTLCYSEILRPQERCRMCVVRVAGEEHLQASCSTEVLEGMEVTTDSDEIRQMRRLMLELLLKEHYGDCVAPCQLTCPAGIDIQGYIALIAQGQYLEALKLIRERIPMPLTIGRVCPHSCEYKCNRNLLDEPVNINHLKRFVADYEMFSGKRNPPDLAPLSGRKVAIVGGGPAGLSAAYYLRCLGHASTIFDVMPELGGMLRYGIPEYRLPKKILDWEIDGILELGNIEVKLGQAWGKDFTLESLKNEGYDAIFIAIGAWSTRKLGIPGEELEGVYAGVDFLVDLALDKPVKTGRNIAIIGGGNVAIDAARNCIRKGAESVTIIYRRSRQEMPASPEEIHGAEEEGVKFHFLAAPVRLIGSNGKLSKLEYVKMELGEPDASGRRRPVPIEGSETQISVDTVIAAIGQFPDLSPIDSDSAAEGMPTTRWHTIGADPENMYTGIEGVFTGGDVYRGPETVVGALADGRKAAFSIHQYFTEGRVKPLPEQFNILKGDLASIDREQFSHVPSEPRACMPELPAEERKSHYEQIELGLSEDAALREAERCLSCGCLDTFDCKLRRYSFEFGIDSLTHTEPMVPFAEVSQKDTHPFILVDPNKCIRCKQCYEACTYFQCSDAIDFDDTPTLNPRCVSCGLCVDMCPTGALEERIQGKPGPFLFERLDAFCPHCGCGCHIVLNIKGGRVYKVTTRPSAPPNYGQTCQRGRFNSFNYLHADNRLHVPLLRQNGELVETTWDDAMGRVASELTRLAIAHGPEAVAAAGSAYATNEANFLLQKIFRTQFGSNNIDYPGSSSSRNTMKGLSSVLGTGSMTNSYREIERADVILALGNTIEECSPIIATALRRASRTNGKRLLHCSSSESPFASFSHSTLIIEKGAELDFLNCLLWSLVRAKLYNQEFVRTATAGFELFLKALEKMDGEQLAARAGIPLSTVEEIARLIAGATSIALVYSEDVPAQTNGIATVEAIANLCLLTGNIGREHSGIYPLYSHINVQGALDMGVLPDHYPGHLSLKQASNRKQFEQTWSAELSAKVGLSWPEILQACAAKKIKGLYFLDGRLPMTAEEIEQLGSSLAEVEFMVVQAFSITEICKYADVILPSLAFTEQSGTFTTMERRLEKLNELISGPGQAMPDWRILADLLAALDPKSSYDNVDAVLEEITSLVPFYAGITYQKLGSSGLQWPLSSDSTQGSGTLPAPLLKDRYEFAVPR